MDLATFTTRSQQALGSAISAAAAAGNPAVEPAHLLSALLTQDGGTAGPLIQAAGVDAQAVRAGLKSALEALPSASGASVQNPGLSRASHEVLQRAKDLADQLGDDFVSTEHLTVGIATVESAAKTLLDRCRRHRRLAAGRVRRRTRHGARHECRRRGHLPVAREVRRRPHRRRARGQARPGHRPRQRDPPRRPGAVPAYEEQPGADRRARRRQDRRRRGPRAAHRRG